MKSKGIKSASLKEYKAIKGKLQCLLQQDNWKNEYSEQQEQNKKYKPWGKLWFFLYPCDTISIQENNYTKT